MPVKLKTKTVIDAMQSLRLIPSFTTQFSGDVLPEAILLKNIMEEMLYSIETLANLETFFLGLKPRDGQDEVNFDGMTANTQLNAALERLYNSFGSYKAAMDSAKSSADKEYEADTETGGGGGVPSAAVTPRSTGSKPSLGGILSSKKSAFASFRSAVRRSSRTRAGLPLTDRLRQEQLWSKVRSKEYRMSELVIRSARSLLLLVQNENSLSGIIERLVEARFRETSPEMAAFSKVLEEFDAYAVSAIGVPYEARTQEMEALCGSIFMTQKFNKSVRKMRVSLEEVEESRRVQMTKKVEEKRELMAAGEEIRLRSRSVISEIRKNVDERVRAMAWKSHARQIKIGELVAKLKTELNHSTHDHIDTETTLRHENNRLETEIQTMIDHYDSEMFRRHNDIERISAEYADEKEALAVATEELERIEAKKEALVEEQRREEEEERNGVLRIIRRKIAAKTIQKCWRAHVARRLLKSKKKKKKKAAAVA